MRRLLFLSMIALGSLFLASPGRAGQVIFADLTASGKKIMGGVNLKGHEGHIACIAYEQKGVLQNGPVPRHYSPIVIRKEIDRSSPILWEAMIKMQVIAGDFRFFRPENRQLGGAGGGVDFQYYTVNIKNARIIGIRQVTENVRNPEQARLPDYEEVTIAYDAITWTFTDGGITASDNVPMPNKQ
jgi:type VI secretion system secreted protein Hcp